MNSNLSKCFLILLGVLLVGASAWAQDNPRAEVSLTVGWTFSDGVSGDARLGPDGNFYDRVDPKDGFDWGFTGEACVGPNTEFGFRFDRQQSKLEVGGNTTTEIGDMNVDNYHGIFSYNFGHPDATARPFVFGGIGATHYGAVDFTFAGAARSINSQTKASLVWGGGLKLHASKNVGVRLEASWVPTYIKSDAEGWFCDPFWGCYLVGDAQYSNQFRMGGGINFRF